MRILLCLLLLLPGFANAGEPTLETLLPGAKVKVSVFGHPEMDREAVIGPRGTVTLPLIGDVVAQGQTPAALAKMITEKLDAGFIVNPSVTVELLEYPPVYVTGLVTSPGSVGYRPHLNVRQTIALAGGFAPRARTSSIKIIRGGTDIDATQESEVLPGDTLEIGRRWF